MGTSGLPDRSEHIRFWLGAFRFAAASGILALVFATSGCRRSSQEAVTLTFIDAEGLHDLSSRKLHMDQAAGIHAADGNQGEHDHAAQGPL